MNIEVSNHMATIEDAEIVKLDATFKKNEGNTQSKPQNRQNQKPQQGVKPQVQSKTNPKSFEGNTAPSKVKVVSPPKTGENKSFSPGKGNKKPFNNNNQNRNNNNNRKKNHTPVVQAQPQVRKVKELPAKITYSESLTVGELAKKYIANHLKSLKSSFY